MNVFFKYLPCFWSARATKIIINHKQNSSQPWSQSAYEYKAKTNLSQSLHVDKAKTNLSTYKTTYIDYGSPSLDRMNDGRVFRWGDIQPGGYHANMTGEITWDTFLHYWRTLQQIHLTTWASSQYKDCLFQVWRFIPMLKIRWSHNHLIFNMGI